MKNILSCNERRNPIVSLFEWFCWHFDSMWWPTGCSKPYQVVVPIMSSNQSPKMKAPVVGPQQPNWSLTGVYAMPVGVDIAIDIGRDRRSLVDNHLRAQVVVLEILRLNGRALLVCWQQNKRRFVCNQKYRSKLIQCRVVWRKRRLAWVCWADPFPLHSIVGTDPPETPSVGNISSLSITFSRDPTVASLYSITYLCE